MSNPLSSDGPLSSDFPNLMDADVPKVVSLLYVGVNDEQSSGALDNGAVSVISVSLLTKLKERVDLRVEQIGMIRDDVVRTMDGGDGEAMNEDTFDPDGQDTTNVNPSLGDALTDEVQTDDLYKHYLRAHAHTMAVWRSERSSSSPCVPIMPSDGPTQRHPQNGAEMARGVLTETLDGVVLVAYPKDGDYPYMVPSYNIDIDTDTNVTYKYIEINEAIRGGLVKVPTLASDPRPSGSDGVTDGNDVVTQLPVPMTYRQQLAKRLNITVPQDDPIKDAEDNRETEHKKNLREINENTMTMAFYIDWMGYQRQTGRPPPTEAVVYWIIYYPFLKDVLECPPYNYVFDVTGIDEIVKGAEELKTMFTDLMDPEDSIKSILASALLKMNTLKRDGITTENERAVFETLKRIIERYTEGQKEVLYRMQMPLVQSHFKTH